jgi:hypothetical protein
MNEQVYTVEGSDISRFKPVKPRSRPKPPEPEVQPAEVPVEALQAHLSNLMPEEGVDARVEQMAVAEEHAELARLGDEFSVLSHEDDESLDEIIEEAVAALEEVGGELDEGSGFDPMKEKRVVPDDQCLGPAVIPPEMLQCMLKSMKHSVDSARNQEVPTPQPWPVDELPAPQERVDIMAYTIGVDPAAPGQDRTVETPVYPPERAVEADEPADEQVEEPAEEPVHDGSLTRMAARNDAVDEMLREENREAVNQLHKPCNVIDEALELRAYVETARQNLREIQMTEELVIKSLATIQSVHTTLLGNLTEALNRVIVLEAELHRPQHEGDTS